MTKDKVSFCQKNAQTLPIELLLSPDAGAKFAIPLIVRSEKQCCRVLCALLKLEAHGVLQKAFREGTLAPTLPTSSLCAMCVKMTPLNLGPINHKLNRGVLVEVQSPKEEGALFFVDAQGSSFSECRLYGTFPWEWNLDREAFPAALGPIDR